MSDTLLLNTSGQPISSFPVSTINWQRAVKLFFLDKVTVLEWYDDWRISSPTTTMQVPATVMIKQFQKIDHNVCFNRHNLAIRDEYRCGYCGQEHNFPDLTIDHVIPRSKGGKSRWDNVVTCCKRCNHNKADKLTPKPIHKPYEPDYWRLASKWRNSPIKIKDPKWEKYLDAGKQVA